MPFHATSYEVIDAILAVEKITALVICAVIFYPEVIRKRGGKN